MEIKSNILIEFYDEKDAKILYDSLSVENEGFLESSIDNNLIEYNINSSSLNTFLATVDDLIFSAITAEKILYCSRKYL
ncbi:MAG: hypothetical protein LBU40_06180 [Methanobrevibacter sp.]|jgi:hypothetical protein|nr:hypothetical protein [Methanobrevibacter sp.]